MDKKTYQQFCENHNLPVFYHPWWLDIVAAGKWKVIAATKGDKITGVLPFVEERKKGLKFIKMPVLTPFLGVWFNYPENQNYHNKLSFEKEVIYQLIEQLPAYDQFNARFPSSFTNWLPFYWQGFHQTVRYTYVIDYEKYHTFEDIQNQFSPKIKKNLKNAEKHQIVVRLSDDISSFIELNLSTFRRKNMQPPYSPSLVKELYEEVKKRNAVRIYTAYTADSQPVASMFMVIDRQTAYYLIGGISEKWKHTQANTLLSVIVIKKMYEEGMKKFDFEGSMIQPIENYFRSFGAEQTPYYQIAKTPSRILRWYKILTNTYP